MSTSRKPRQVHGAPGDGEQEGAEGADAGRLRRAEHTAVDAAHHEDEQGQHAPDIAQGAQPAGPVRALAARPERRPQGDHRANRQHVEEDPDDARNHTGGEQFADIGLGQDAVDHQQHAGRDQDAEGAAGGDRAGRQPVVVAVTAHRRHGDLRHGRRGGEAGAADRAEAAAGDDRRHRQAALAMAQKGVGGGVQFLRQAGPGDEVAHEDEQRHHGKLVVDRRVERCLADIGQRPPQIHRPAHADEADNDHREGDGDAQEGQRQQRRETQQRDGHVARPEAWAGSVRAPVR